MAKKRKSRGMSAARIAKAVREMGHREYLRGYTAGRKKGYAEALAGKPRKS